MYIYKNALDNENVFDFYKFIIFIRRKNEIVKTNFINIISITIKF